jgi:hypothetical protein
VVCKLADDWLVKMLVLMVLSMVPLTQVVLSGLPPRQYFIREPDNQTAIQGEQVGTARTYQ